MSCLCHRWSVLLRGNHCSGLISDEKLIRLRAKSLSVGHIRLFGQPLPQAQISTFLESMAHFTALVTEIGETFVRNLNQQVFPPPTAIFFPCKSGWVISKHTRTRMRPPHVDLVSSTSTSITSPILLQMKCPIVVFRAKIGRSCRRIQNWAVVKWICLICKDSSTSLNTTWCLLKDQGPSRTVFLLSQLFKNSTRKISPPRSLNLTGWMSFHASS